MLTIDEHMLVTIPNKSLAIVTKSVKIGPTFGPIFAKFSLIVWNTGAKKLSITYCHCSNTEVKLFFILLIIPSILNNK